MDVVTVDPQDDAAFRAWFAVTEAAHDELWPGQPGWQLEELRAKAIAPGPAVRVELIGVRDDAGQLIGSARLDMPLTDNTNRAEATLTVHPGRRRFGAGSVLLAELERRTLADGRSWLTLVQDEPTRHAGGSPGRSFAVQHGYAVAQALVRRDLSLPADASRLTDIEASCAPFTAGYRLQTWFDRCPDELVDERALLARRMSTDAPAGDLVLEEEQWDATRVRAEEELLERQSRKRIATGAVEEASGHLVGITEIAIPRDVPQTAYQWDTVVLREHRGHRLGLWLKVANLRVLAEASPATQRISTWNADDNTHMIAVNEALGFQVVGRLLSWQKKLDGTSD
jgi:GNAT superfamily N-acetyltransferase